MGKLYRPHFFCCCIGAGIGVGGGGTVDTAHIERAIEAMGFEVVTLERGGVPSRPRLRVRIDHVAGAGRRSPVTVEDCAAVARGVRELLEADGDAATSWALEVSSPGVERPLNKASDYARFAGERVRVRGFAALANRRKQLEGTLLGLVEGTPEAFALDIGGERVEIPLEAVASTRLVYEWNDESDSDRAKI